jgi:hypothetical protein
VRDGYGESMDRSGVCRGGSVIVRTTDTCPCNYRGNYYSNKRWCCGDANHFDLVRGGACGAQGRRLRCRPARARARARPPPPLGAWPCLATAPRPASRPRLAPRAPASPPTVPPHPPLHPRPHPQSVWAFEKLADMKWGVINIAFRQVDCGAQPEKRASAGGFPGVFPPGACGTGGGAPRGKEPCGMGDALPCGFWFERGAPSGASTPKLKPACYPAARPRRVGRQVAPRLRLLQVRAWRGGGGGGRPLSSKGAPRPARPLRCRAPARLTQPLTPAPAPNPSPRYFPNGGYTSIHSPGGSKKMSTADYLKSIGAGSGGGSGGGGKEAQYGRK